MLIKYLYLLVIVVKLGFQQCFEVFQCCFFGLVGFYECFLCVNIVVYGIWYIIFYYVNFQQFINCLLQGNGVWLVIQCMDIFICCFFQVFKIVDMCFYQYVVIIFGFQFIEFVVQVVNDLIFNMSQGIDLLLFILYFLGVFQILFCIFLLGFNLIEQCFLLSGKILYQ